jgi:hypothetical protein
MSNTKRAGIKHWHVTLPQGLADSVDIRLMDPLRGRIRYGARSGLVEELLTKWLQAETSGAQVTITTPSSEQNQ